MDTALSVLIDDATSPYSPLSDNSFVPSLIELENIDDQEIPIDKEMEQIRTQPCYVALKREDLEWEFSSVSTTPPESPNSNDQIVKKTEKKGSRKEKKTKKKSKTGKERKIRSL